MMRTPVCRGYLPGTLDGELVLTLASDEETMDRWGTAYLLEPLPEARGDAMVEALRRFEPTATDRGHEGFRLLRDNAEEVMGRWPVLNMRVGASDALLYCVAGVPTAVYEPTPYSMGGPDEHVTLDDLNAIARVYALTAFDFLTPPGGDRP